MTKKKRRTILTTLVTEETFVSHVHITFSLYLWPIDVAFSRIVNLTKKVIVPVILCLHMDVRLFNCFYYLKDEINILTVAK